MNSINRRSFLAALGMGAASYAFPLSSSAAESNSNLNVLFICVDDLRPQLGCYGQQQMISPHIDRLAAESVQFNRCFCQVPVCGASRASLLTGVRPTPTRFIGHDARADEDYPGGLSLPMHFKDNGYTTISLGKVYHFPDDGTGSWSERPWRPSESRYQLAENQALESEHGQGPAYENADVEDSAYNDGKLTEEAISYLQRFQDSSEPFFLAVGYMKPHLPFNAPKTYWDYYNEENIDTAENPFAPRNAPQESLHNWTELRDYFGIPANGALSDETARTLIHGYYACTSYIDAQIGLLLDELEALGLKDNTIVVLWGDHGWNLGEHGLWCKHANFNTCLNAPLIVQVPSIEGGIQTDALTEFVDIYPTLCELCGLNLPSHLEGTSFVPLLSDPEREWKEAVFSRYYYADTIKTDRYGYTEWSEDGEIYARMLYDHEVDPQENTNIAEFPVMADTVNELSSMLHAGWESFVPSSESPIEHFLLY